MGLHLPARLAAACLGLAMIWPGVAMADPVSVAAGTTASFELIPDLVPVFEPGLDMRLEFLGPDASYGGGIVTAPVHTVSVPGQGPGAITIDWGAGLLFKETQYGLVSAQNFSLSIADAAIYADYTFTDLGTGEVRTFTHLAGFYLTDMSGDLDGVPLDQVVAGQTLAAGQLSFSAKVIANPAAYNEVMAAFGYGPTELGGDLTVGQVTISAIPEPATWATMGLGLVGLVAVSRRRRRA